MEKEYWVVAYAPEFSCYECLFTSKKPKYLKSINSWEPQTNDSDWHVGPCWILGDNTIDDIDNKYKTPRKVKIHTEFK